jgi:hypothetical protein
MIDELEELERPLIGASNPMQADLAELPSGSAKWWRQADWSTGSGSGSQPGPRY